MSATSARVIAVVGEIGSRRPALLEQFARLPGVASVTPDQPAVQAGLARVPPGGHGHPGPRRRHRRRVADGHGRARAPSRARSSCSRRPTPSRRPARRSCAAARSSRAPRPYAFQGLGVAGPALLAEARERTGLPVITEVMEPNQVDIVAEYADILQIGTRNMQNYSLLRDVGRVARPVMLKRGYGATIEEWLMAAEYIVSSGNPNVILCERGIRTFETFTRNTLDLAAVPRHQPPDPPAGHRRSEPRHREALAGQAAGPRRRRGRGRRDHGRGPPAPRRRPVRRRAAARLRGSAT